jgi:hypothetical protein
MLRHVTLGDGERLQQKRTPTPKDWAEVLCEVSHADKFVGIGWCRFLSGDVGPSCRVLAVEVEPLFEAGLCVWLDGVKKRPGTQCILRSCQRSSQSARITMPKALEDWESEGGAPASEDRSTKRKRPPETCTRLRRSSNSPHKLNRRGPRANVAWEESCGSMWRSSVPSVEASPPDGTVYHRPPRYPSNETIRLGPLTVRILITGRVIASRLLRSVARARGAIHRFAFNACTRRPKLYIALSTNQER